MLSGIRLKQKITPVAAKFLAAGNVHRYHPLYACVRTLTLPVVIRRLRISPSLASTTEYSPEKRMVTKSKFGKLVTFYLSEKAVKEVSTFLQK